MKEKEKRLINGSDLIFSRVEEEMKNVGRNGEIGLESKEWKRKKEEDELAVGGLFITSSHLFVYSAIPDSAGADHRGSFPISTVSGLPVDAVL